jgi:hypothetical protein
MDALFTGGRPETSRFVLTNSLSHSDSGWNIYPTRGTKRFQALVLGQNLELLTAGGARPLS